MNLRRNRMRILYLFTLDWNHEVEDFGKGIVPAHRLFGFADLQGMGHAPFLCPPSPKLLRRWLWKPAFWRVYQALYAFFKQFHTDCIFGVNEASTLPVLFLKRLGLLRTPVIVFCTGLMHPRNRGGLKKVLWKWLLPCAEAVVSQTSMELKSTWREFGLREDRQFLIHMLVDVNTFHPDPAREKGDFILAAGTNEGRDYPTLLEALPKGQRLIVVTDHANAEIVRSHIKPGMQVELRQALPILELKALYERAKVVVNPLVETDYCSGHTVLLENMALGNPIIIARVEGMNDYVEDGVTAITYKPGDSGELRRKIEESLNAPEQFAQIGRRASGWVRRFSTEEFAKKLIRVAEQVCAKSRSHSESVVALN
jgi:glycosyltransferase involved in cell wall biosynthesis